MRKLFLFLLLSSLVSPSSFAQVSSRNINLVSQLSFNVKLNDIWGYVDPNGVEYAILGLRNGVSIVSLADPFNPKEIQFLPGIFSPWRDIKTFQNYAYVSNESGDGLRIIDLSALPNKVSYKDSTFAGFTTAHNLYQDEGVLYVVGTDIFNGGMMIFDLKTDPWNPEFNGVYSLRYVHDVYVRNKIAYTAEISDRRMSIVDVSNPSQPELLGQIAYEGAFTHNTWLNDAGDVCFTTDEYGGAYVHAWDVSNPGDIKLLDRIKSKLSMGEAAPHNTHVINDYLVNSYYRDGIQITDASRPGNLIEVGHFDTSESLSGDGFNGSWGAYPYLPSGLILASDIENGLFVLDPTYERGCYLEGTIRDNVTLETLSDVTIEILNENIQEQSKEDGSYATGIGEAGTYKIALSKFGYEPDTIEVILENGMLKVLDIELISLRRIKLDVEVKEKNSGEIISDAQVVLIARGSGVKFNYLSNDEGKVQDPRLVVSPYEVIVGKWGYVTKNLLIDPTDEDVILKFELEKGYYDDFSLDFGWEVDGTASKGTWEIGEPDGTYRNGNIYAPEYDLAEDIGNQAFVTDNQDNGAFGYDVDNGYTRLISPWMDLSSYEGPVIHYNYWLVNWSIRGGNQRRADGFMSVSLTDGRDTVQMKRYDMAFDTTWTLENKFYPFFFNVRRRPLRVIFYVQDLSTDNQDAVEAAIDGFRVVDNRVTSTDTFLEEMMNLRLYPTPVQNFLNLHIEIPWDARTDTYQFSLYDFRGRELFRKELTRHTRDYQFEFPYSSGLYLGQILKNGNIISSRKILK